MQILKIIEKRVSEEESSDLYTYLYKNVRICIHILEQKELQPTPTASAKSNS